MFHDWGGERLLGYLNGCRSELGRLFYIMVDSVADTVNAIFANRGETVPPIGTDVLEIMAKIPIRQKTCSGYISNPPDRNRRPPRSRYTQSIFFSQAAARGSISLLHTLLWWIRKSTGSLDACGPQESLSHLLFCPQTSLVRLSAQL
jgi:hypothetical protein